MLLISRGAIQTYSRVHASLLYVYDQLAARSTASCVARCEVSYSAGCAARTASSQRASGRKEVVKTAVYSQHESATKIYLCDVCDVKLKGITE